MRLVEERLVEERLVKERLVVWLRGWRLAWLVAMVVSAVAFFATRRARVPADPVTVFDFLALTDERYVVAPASGGVIVSGDAGDSWQATNTFTVHRLARGGDGTVWAFGVAPADPRAQPLIGLSRDGAASFETAEVRGNELQPAAFVSEAENDPMLLMSDGTLWRHYGDTIAWSDWHLYRDTPERGGHFSAGLMLSPHRYLADAERIYHWRENAGRNVTRAAVPGVVALTSTGDACWAVTHDGRLYNTTCGNDDWSVAMTLPGVGVVHDAASRSGALFVSGSSKEGGAYFVSVRPPDAPEVLAGLAGAPRLGVRFDVLGSALAVGPGVQRWDGKRWEQLWPPPQ